MSTQPPTETMRAVMAQAWAHAVARDIARRIFERKPIENQADVFERTTLRARCTQIAVAEDLTLGTVVWQVAAGERLL